MFPVRGRFLHCLTCLNWSCHNHTLTRLDAGRCLGLYQGFKVSNQPGIDAALVPLHCFSDLSHQNQSTSGHRLWSLTMLNLRFPELPDIVQWLELIGLCLHKRLNLSCEVSSSKIKAAVSRVVLFSITQTGLAALRAQGTSCSYCW